MPLLRLLCATLLLAAAAHACRDGGTSGEPPPAGGGGGGGGDGGGDGGGGGGAPTTPGWIERARENFEGGALPASAFAPDPVPDDGPFSDGGAYFTSRGVTPPAAFRATQPFGKDGWLTVESYSRRGDARLADHAEVVADPAGGANHVLRLRSQQHTDGTVVRPTAPLPSRYRVSLRAGFPAFGDGEAGGNNGYDAGDETAGPWWPEERAASQNGFYWLTILDALPRPHNNTWIHHHRKVVIDSDNHHPAWMETWTGDEFVWSGEHPIMMIALDGSRPGDVKTGNAFFSWSNGAWQPSGAIRAVDAYLPDRWYRVTIERDGPRYTLEVSGTFRYGGEGTYRAEIDAAQRCVWHYPVDAAEAAGAAGCVDEGAFVEGHPRWPAGGAWPDWFMFGDPHVNYYEGEVYYDDVVLEVWRD
ncbi:hypothetical protein [Anaeromyxobacter sp. Fw109-5]|uniref:hypothetical protein n=1 Tax=Anaeromyxobacter sp. (strain Fw109-5) TaxID=404589 RepID=UPI000158A801|nr:hypothetical protein [Anaeromyxobacter sp. Fw109-5]ABS28370.1 conserved hypothetical protein [Anaeromyxobacter sp. Fw109-5]